MKITEVRVIVTSPGRNHVVVKVLTDEGVHGVGEGTLNGSELAVAEALRHSSWWSVLGVAVDQAGGCSVCLAQARGTHMVTPLPQRG